MRLGGFSKDQTALVRQMEDYGWTGRIGANGHAFMLAPDGITTCSVVPKDGSRRQRGNSQAVFKAWLKKMEELAAEAIERAEQRELTSAMGKLRFTRMFQPESTPIADTLLAVIPDHIPERLPEPPAPVDTAPAPAPERSPEFQCPICGREFAGRQPLSVHHVRSHVKVACPVCDHELPPGNLPRHQRKYHPPVEPELMARQLWLAQQELSQLRAEVRGWEQLAVETEERYAALRDRHNSVVAAINTLQNVLEA